MRIVKYLVLALILVGLISTPAFSINLKVSRQDQKLATQQMIEKDTIAAPIIANSIRILSSSNGDTDGTGATVTTFAAQPDVARSLAVLPAGQTGDVAAGNVTVTGTDLHGITVSETFEMVANQTLKVFGSIAFLTVTSIAFPAEDTPFEAQWNVGVEDKLGLRRCMDSIGHVIFATLDGIHEATRPTVEQSTALGGNTANIDGTLDGAKDVEIFYIQNYTCLP